jgi:filamentous hemagglutinin family protein
MNPKTLFSLLAATGSFLNAEMASDQSLPPSVRTPQADKTLGTQVSGNGNNFNITGGLNRGQTLFHSFKDFSIPTGGAANFNNPAGTRDIITRVTGNLFSDINGTLNSNGANFLLINPNGVVFGPNARLNVGKAFAASTASGVDLVDGQGRQLTFGTNPNGDAPLLKINPNVFFNVSRLNMGANVPNNPGVVNYGKLQTNNDSQYIGLIGGNVTLDGKYGGGKIVTPGGRIDLGGLNSAGTVSTDAQGLVFGESGLVRGDVLLTNDASVTARANETLGTVNPFFSNLAVAGSNININANNLNVLNSGAKSKTGFAAIDNGLAENSGVKTQPAGNININATGLVNLDNADIKNTLRSGAEGKNGDINIDANSLSLINQSIISSTTAGKGNAGNINVTTTGDISISGTTLPQSTKPASPDNTSAIFSATQGRGDAGKITLDTQNQGKFSLSNRADIASTIEKNGIGNGNDINISAREVDIRNESSISSDNLGGKGDAGNINITTTGDISISGSTPKSTAPTTQNPDRSFISSGTFFGQGNTGKITIDTQNRGKFSLDGASISSGISGKDTVGNSQGISISAREVELRNRSSIDSANLGGKGDAGNIDLKTIGDVSLSGLFTSISSGTSGQGNTGKITIDTQNRGKFSLDDAAISSDIFTIGKDTVGNSQGISISAREIELKNGTISTANLGGKGDAGNIDLKTIGDVSLSGFFTSISSGTNGQGNSGKITIDTQNRGKISLDDARISSDIFTIGKDIAVGTSQGISISAREIELKNGSKISTANRGGKGDAGNIDLKTIGDISLSGILTSISSGTSGQGNSGKITIDTQNRGKISLNEAEISSDILSFDKDITVGNGQGISISAREIELKNGSKISTANRGGKGDAGNIDLKTIGDISLSGILTLISSGTTDGQGNSGKITIDTQNRGKLSLDRARISSGIITLGKDKDTVVVGNGQEISISVREIDLRNRSSISSANGGGKGDAGNIIINAKGDLELADNSFITSNNLGVGKTGDILLNIDRITLNSGSIQAQSVGGIGGNIQLTASDLLLLRNSSNILTRSGSNEKNGNGGNITINSPLIIALPGDNNISADAFTGNGGRVDIVSKGLFGIQFRPRLSNLTNDITSSSTFGQSGVVDIKTPGTDPGKDSTILPTVPTDASNQIAQTCNASRENKFIIAGRGGLPPNANDPLTSDVVWQDARATNSQPTASSTTNDPNKLPPPAVGLAFDGKGKAFLIAAGNEGQPTGTSVVCPNVVRK